MRRCELPADKFAVYLKLGDDNGQQQETQVCPAKQTGLCVVCVSDG